MKLFATKDGVTHWVYEMHGVLCVCGKLNEYGFRYRLETAFPTCLQCIVLVFAERHEGQAWL